MFIVRRHSFVNNEAQFDNVPNLSMDMDMDMRQSSRIQPVTRKPQTN